MAPGAVLEGLLRRDRAVVIAGLGLVIVLSWAYLLLGAGGGAGASAGMAGMAMARASWSPAYFALMLAMWTIMMMAMMLPSAAPTILLVNTLARRRAAAGGPAGTAGLFALGYLAAWLGFSLLATLLQWGLDRAALLTPEMASASEILTGLLLLAAGIYEWTPLKQACLRHCRSPLDFLLHHWREGRRAAAAAGLAHGLYCLGCCWMLMTLLFVTGLMNLVWVAALALLVLMEKLLPGGRWTSRGAGAAFIAGGGAMLLRLG